MRYEALLSRLSTTQTHRLGELQAKCQRILQIYQDQQVNEFTVATNTDALKRLEWIFLKLLVAQHYLNDGTSHLLDGSSFGDLSTTIDAMDQTFSEPVRQPSAGPAETSVHRPSATEKLSS
jgi:hypothetical protein